MLYNPPTGAATANDPYVGKNTAAGTQGSKIPPAAIEYPQREIVAVENEAGIPPTNTDLKQLMRAIRSGRLSIYQDVGTPNAIIATSLTAHTSYVPGMPLCFKLTNDVTGATTVNLDGLGVIPCVFPGGSPLQRFDYLAGDLVVGRINAAGTGFIVTSPINGALIDTAIVRSIHGTGAHFPDLNAALTWVNRRRVAATGSVTFQLAAGVGVNKLIYNADIIFSHPDGARIAIQGQPLGGALPPLASLTYSGTGTAARASDAVTNLALLRNTYATEIYFSGGHRVFGQGNLGNFQNVLFTSDATGSGVDGILWQTGNALLTNIAIIGAQLRGLCSANAFVSLAGTCYAIGSGASGVTAENGGVVSLQNTAVLISQGNAQHGVASFSGTFGPATNATATVHARGNAGDGIVASTGKVTAGTTWTSSYNAGSGFDAIYCGSIFCQGAAAPNNGLAGFVAAQSGYIEASNTSGSANASYGYYALNGGGINRAGGTATGGLAPASPAVGASGNNNGFIS